MQPTTWGSPRIAEAPIDPETMYDRIDDSFDAMLSSHSGATRPTYGVAGTVWHDTDNAELYHFTGVFDSLLLGVDANGDVTIPAGNLIVTTPETPASATATGTVGTIAWDTGFIYVCTATDTWVRAAIATW